MHCGKNDTLNTYLLMCMSHRLDMKHLSAKLCLHAQIQKTINPLNLISKVMLNYPATPERTIHYPKLLADVYYTMNGIVWLISDCNEIASRMLSDCSKIEMEQS